MTRTEPTDEHKAYQFSKEELGEIIRGALERGHRLRDENVTYKEMLEVGTELGIEAAHLDAAAAEVAERRDGQNALKHRKLEFFLHIATSGVVVIGLLLINLVSSPSVIWIQYPAIVWGIAIGIHGAWLYANKKAVLMGIGPLDLGMSEEEEESSSTG